MATIEELEARLAAQKEEQAKAEVEQYAKDLEALIDLRAKHDAVATVAVAKFRRGFPTRAYVRTPASLEYKRYVDQVGRAVDKKSNTAIRSAQDLLAQSCWVYPEKPEDKSAMLEAFPGLLTSIALAAVSLAEGRAEEEGKG